MPIHLRPSAELAPQAILTGDPGRAMAIAQAVLAPARMSNHHRGLWGYTGPTEEGWRLTVQSTGMGGPSAAIVLEELAGLGVRRAIRIGSCGALGDDLHLGATLIVEGALVGDGTAKALGAADQISGDPGLTARLREAAPGARPAKIVSTDLFYERDPDWAGRWAERGAEAVEMETSTIFALGQELGLRVAAALVVSDLVASRARIDDGELELQAIGLAEAAVRALRP